VSTAEQARPWWRRMLNGAFNSHYLCHLRQDALLAEAATQREVAHHFADELVERWHEDEGLAAGTLAQWMGLTDEQYALFVACDFTALGAALASSAQEPAP
jgi:hypothetical protein